MVAREYLCYDKMDWGSNFQEIGGGLLAFFGANGEIVACKGF